MRAAENLLTVEEPKLAAVAVGSLTAEDFASRLERAVNRANGAGARLMIDGHATRIENEDG